MSKAIGGPLHGKEIDSKASFFACPIVPNFNFPKSLRRLFGKVVYWRYTKKDGQGYY
jgi:hypothetical protein